ncbi:Glycosyl transferase family 2 [Pseudooceanicola antarcticus]|uniref:Glycosyl transferase family 2 n=1 Tax=Pseudooceanicola antarcticus TaxID=1247613 RepID=A0A285IPZ2_9RHOB|nr:glycosyltransferase family 2 protein [Pseudooceanicola antarcticus]PJE31413.1 hypothetical protein CVM39_03400 [Pseudooceanicola antarcticus]SNY50089.1 Glycosyl transferase family 2 [Pseudooceanicola antarcticus]
MNMVPKTSAQPLHVVNLKDALESGLTFGQLLPKGVDVGILIDRETRIDLLEAALAKSREWGDLRWSLCISRRLSHLSDNGRHWLDFTRFLLAAQDHAAAARALAEVRREDVKAEGWTDVAFRVAIGLRDEARAREIIAELPEDSPLTAPLRLELVKGLFVWGSYAEARRELDAIIAEHGATPASAMADARLVMAEEGPLAALKRLDEHSDVLPPASEAYRGLKLEFMIHRGRYNEALDLALAWLEDAPLSEALYGPAAWAAREADRAVEFGAVLSELNRKYPSRLSLAEALCNHAIEIGDQAAYARTLRQIRERGTWTWMLLQFSAACHSPLETNVASFFRMLRSDGIRYPGVSVLYAVFLYYYQHETSWLEQAHELVEELRGSAMNDPSVLALHLRLLIALNRDEEAEAAYDALPRGMTRVAELAPFRMYFQARAGQDEEARKGWVRHLGETAHIALNARSSYPEEVQIRFDGTPGQVLSFTTVFNGIEYVEWFLGYYRDLGVDHFFFVDNGSTDGTVEFLRDQPDVSLLSNPGSFAASACGVFWLNHVMRRYGVGHWCLHLDIDEALVFPGMDSGRSLAQMLAYFDANGFELAGGMMIDIYPDALQSGEESNPFEASCYIDRDYVSMRNELPPYAFVKGGIRAKRTGRSLMMTKAPLVKMRPDTAYFANNHNCGHQKMADISVALLHYKFIGAFTARVKEAVDRREHFQGAHFYKLLQRDFSEKAGGEQLVSGSSVRYRGAAHLVDLGLLRTSSAWEGHEWRAGVDDE